MLSTETPEDVALRTQEIDLANALDLPKDVILAGVALVRERFPGETIEEIWFSNEGVLIVKRFWKGQAYIGFPPAKR